MGVFLKSSQLSSKSVVFQIFKKWCTLYTYSADNGLYSPLYCIQVYQVVISADNGLYSPLYTSLLSLISADNGLYSALYTSLSSPYLC